MPGPDFEALLRVAAELFYRSHRVKRHLDEVRSLPAPEYRQLTDAIQKTLDDVELPLIEAIDSAAEVGEESIPSPMFDALQRFSHWFSVAHELLVYLPSPSVLPETGGLLAKAFGDVYSELKPSVILGSLFNAFHFDFYENLGRVLPDFRKISPPEGKRPVLQQPVSDRKSPAGWGILAHEMGHAIDRSRNISKLAVESVLPGLDSTNTTFSVLSSWAKEFCADLIAAEALGPAAIIALLSIEYSIYPLRPIHKYTKTHPATIWRLDAASSYLSRKYKCDFLNSELEQYRKAWSFSVSRTLPDDKDRQDFIELNQLLVEKFVKPLCEAIIAKMNPVFATSHYLEKESIDRCLLRLHKGLPIGAQGATRPSLRKLLAEFQSTKFSNDAERTIAFGKLTEAFRESPLPVPALLVSCAKRREILLGQAIERITTDADDGVAWLRTELDRFNELAVTSINSAMIHEFYR